MYDFTRGRQPSLGNSWTEVSEEMDRNPRKGCGTSSINRVPISLIHSKLASQEWTHILTESEYDNWFWKDIGRADPEDPEDPKEVWISRTGHLNHQNRSITWHSKAGQRCESEHKKANCQNSPSCLNIAFTVVSQVLSLETWT